MILQRVISSTIEKGFRIIKTTYASLVETRKNANPFGFDSVPIEDLIAITSDTLSQEDPVVVGYLNKKTLELLKVGESMMYSTDDEGEYKSIITLRKDGTAEILGIGDFMVRYNKLDAGMQKFVNDLNTQLTTALAPVPFTWVNVPLDISKSKIEEIKTLDKE